MTPIADTLIDKARKLGKTCGKMRFSEPVWAVYNTFDYAIPGYIEYIRAYGNGPKRVLFLGMNPGPWGMAQTGVPFGEVAAVRDWMGIAASIGQPPKVHPKRPIEGLQCPRSEVSGRRLWGLFSEIHESAQAFFADAFVMNYCPLAFLLESGANLTPDRLPAAERAPMETACDQHLRDVVALLDPELLVGVGGFATKCLQRTHPEGYRIGTLLHPSPASPIANREWPERPIKQLEELGLLS